MFPWRSKLAERKVESTVRSSSEDLKKFKDSIIWKDIEECLIDFRDGATEELILSPEDRDKNFGSSDDFLRGEIRAYGRGIDLLDILINDAELIEKQVEEEQENEQSGREGQE